MPRRPDVPCAGCGKLIWRGKGVLPPGQSTCRECRKLGRLTACCACGNSFMAARGPGGYRRTTCSNACAQRLRLVAPRTWSTRMANGICPCGAPTTGAKVFCDTCRAARARARWRQKNAQRRARYRGTSIGKPARVMSIQELGRRDGWRCHLCRKVVRPTLRHPHPGAPTFDHLIPISDGGDDRPENLRLAHFRCNSSRGNRGTVQLLLIG